ncbi:UNVERIFIED_CONTAM: hypothetical protein HDU68_005827 [Siphonaria sp. JEL0065]|nr:hypothetical protein HDU68_005827 [Siphonaria sp. JEL0065]
MRSSCLVLLLAALAVSASAATQQLEPNVRFCVTGEDFCLSVSPGLRSDNRIVTLETNATSQMASIAFGTSHMGGGVWSYVCWAGSKGPVCSRRKLEGHRMPAFESNVQAVATPSTVSSSSTFAASFVVPSSLFRVNNLPCVYAVAMFPPPLETRDDPAAPFGSHGPKRGSFLLDAASDSSLLPTSISRFCTSDQNHVCVVAAKVDGATEFTAYSSAKGWIAWGTGSTMKSSTMFCAWKNEVSPFNLLVSQRIGAGHELPEQYKGQTEFTQIDIPSYIALPAGTSLSFSIRVPDNINVINFNQATRFIYAVGNTAPRDPTSADSFPMHDSYGRFKLDISKPGDSVVSGDSHEEEEDERVDWVKVHAWCMWIGWAVCCPVAVFTARYLKNHLGHKWYILHKWIMLLVGLLTLFAFLAILANKSQERSLHARHGGRPRTFSRSAHKFIGKLLVFFGIPAQIALGYAINHLFRQSRVSIPWWDRLHWYTGRFIAAAALLNIHFGLLYFQASKWVVFLNILWIIGGSVGFWWYGERQFGGAVHHISKASESGESFAYSEVDDVDAIELSSK